MKRASEDALAKLHSVVAEVLAEQVGTKASYDDESEDEYTATPALLTVAARFLKDNEITCEAGASKGTSKLQEKLEQRKKDLAKKKLASITRIDKEMYG